MVDDNEFNLAAFELIFKNAFEMKVDKARNGFEGAALIEEKLNRYCCHERGYKLVIVDF